MDVDCVPLNGRLLIEERGPIKDQCRQQQRGPYEAANQVERLRLRALFLLCHPTFAILAYVAKILPFLLLVSGFAHAEFLRIEVFIRDMNCPSCTDTLVSAFKRMRGVEKVDVDFKAGTVNVELAPQNRVGVEQAWDAIKRVGFTPGETKVTVRGNVKGSRL